MKIAESTVLLTSNHSYTETRTIRESLRLWRNGTGNNGTEPASPLTPSEFRGKSSLNGRNGHGIKKGLTWRKPRSTGKIRRKDPIVWKISKRDQQRILVLEKLLQALTGKKIKLLIPAVPQSSGNSASTPISEQAVTTETASMGATPPAPWGLEYTRTETYQETEQLTFTASGLIKTADGAEINFSVELNMNREFAVMNRIDFKAGAGKPVDPLIINYNGKAAELSDTRFCFDLDSDGQEELIPFLRPGSGFLVLDANDDGLITDGSELFGPATGDGFAELAAYDSDNNGWIDATDPIYERLRIWTRDENGVDRLFALGQKGVGAVYLGNIAAPFQYKDAQNRLDGENQKAGIFLGTDGTVGTVQQIDFLV